MISSFLHVKLDVEDLDRSLAFYIGMLGLREIVRYDVVGSHTIVQVSPTGQPPGIELWYEPPFRPRRDDRVHIAFGTGNVAATVETLVAKGVTVLRHPFRVGHEMLAFVYDPDGYLIELSQQ